MAQFEQESVDDDNRFFDHTPGYIQGELSADEHAWMEAYLAQHPAARQQIEFDRALMRGVDAMVEAIPQDYGLDELRRRRENLTRQIVRAKQPSVSLLDKLKAWFNTGSGFAVAMSVVALQFAVILFMAGTPSFDDAYVQHRGMAQQAAPQASAKINLSPEAPLGDVLALLRTQSATIVAGPGATGELWIALPEGDSQSLEALRASPLVEAITVLTNLPK